MSKGQMKGASISKARLKKGSKVVYKKEILYGGFENSPVKEGKYTVEGIYSTHVKLKEIPSINFALSSFFNYFTELKWDAEDEEKLKEKQR